MPTVVLGQQWSTVFQAESSILTFKKQIPYCNKGSKVRGEMVKSFLNMVQCEGEVCAHQITSQGQSYFQEIMNESGVTARCEFL